MPAEGSGPAGRRGDSARAAGPSFVCENLEPRLLLSVYAVTNVNDSGAGSLRQALLDANAHANANTEVDTITFNIGGGGVHTIIPLSVLPDITEAVILDATSQPGYAGTPVVELNGASAGNNRSGLTLESGSDGSTIRGLAINRFGGDGIHITHSSGNLIEYNFIGTDPTGTLARGNGGDGVELYFYAANNVIRYNVISANAWGISIGIGSVEDARNLIQANKIGTDVTGTLALGNTTAGITAGFGSTSTLIGGSGTGEGNIIAFNGIGIELRQNAAGHSFLGNSIFSNGSLGIDLGSDGVTANDAGDGDSGANNGQNYPVLTSAQLISATEVAIVGSLNSTANSYYRIEFFASTAADGSGYGEGQRYLGFVNIATGGTGNAAINVILTAVVAPGEFITATATRSDSTFSTFTDTSEFARSVMVVSHIVHTPSVTGATTDEDTQTTSGLVISRSPADGTEVTYFKITGITNGTLYQNDGTTPIAAGSFITVAEGDAGLKFTPAANFNGSGYFTVQASTSDNDAGLGGGTVVATITVNAVNDAPVLDLDADDSAGQAGTDFAAIFTEGGPAVGIADADAALSDIDSATLRSLTITITNRRDGAAESLAADTTGTSITASYNSSTGVLTLSGTDTVVHYQQVLRTIRYRNTAQALDTTARRITFVANDGTHDSSVGTTIVTMVALNNSPVVSDQSFSVAENATNGTSVGTVTASDPDAGDHLAYAIVAGNTAGAFTINSTTGQIIVANTAALDYETRPTFILTVEVTDSGTPARTASAIITIHLADRNEAPAINNQSFSVAENAATGTAIGTVVASDPDAGDHLTYAITAGNTGEAFTIDSTTGEITVASPAVLDYEAHATFTLTMEVTDSGTPGQAASAAVIIHLVDQNEAPVVNNQSSWADENAANGTVVGTVVASDVDAGDRLAYAVVAGNTGGAFAIDGTTGQITVANRAALDYETKPTFHLTVRVTDTGGLAAEATVTVNLNGVNEAPLILAPGFLFTQRAVSLVFRSADGTGISIRDVDAGAASIRMEIQVTNGSMTLAGAGGLTFVRGDGVDDAVMIFTGTVAAVNAALEGLTFTPQPNYMGIATLQLAVDDQGNSGSGGPLGNAGAVEILVGAAPRPPEEPEVPIPPKPANPEPELPPQEIPSEPEPQDLGEDVANPTIAPVPTEAPVVPDTPTVDSVLPRQGSRPDVTPTRQPVSPAPTPKEAKPEDSSTPAAEGDTGEPSVPQPEEHVQNRTDINAASAALAESVQANTAMWSQVESMKGQMDRAAGIQHRQQAIAVGMATGVSMSFAAGYVIWLLRGGSLLASLLAASPLWKSFDPLPVLASWEKRKKERPRPGKKDKSNSDDEHELDGLFGASEGTTPPASRRAME